MAPDWSHVVLPSLVVFLSVIVHGKPFDSYYVTACSWFVRFIPRGPLSNCVFGCRLTGLYFQGYMSGPIVVLYTTHAQLYTHVRALTGVAVPDKSST